VTFVSFAVKRITHGVIMNKNNAIWANVQVVILKTEGKAVSGFFGNDCRRVRFGAAQETAALFACVRLISGEKKIVLGYIDSGLFQGITRNSAAGDSRFHRNA